MDLNTKKYWIENCHISSFTFEVAFMLDTADSKNTGNYGRYYPFFLIMC